MRQLAEDIFFYFSAWILGVGILAGVILGLGPIGVLGGCVLGGVIALVITEQRRRQLQQYKGTLEYFKERVNRHFNAELDIEEELLSADLSKKDWHELKLFMDNHPQAKFVRGMKEKREELLEQPK